MNVNPGDLAIVTRGQKVAGRIVEVVSPCPRNVRFRLPDGALHEAVIHEWIVKFQNPVEAPMSIGTRATVWAAAPDSALRPVNGLPIDDEVHSDIKEPA
jgi:hypothetical protein